MNVKKCLKNKLFNSIFGCFFALIGLFAPLMVSTPVFADPVDNTPTPTTEVTEPAAETTTEENKEPKTCSSQVAKVGWIVCSVTEAASTATDFLYNILEKLIVVKPITSGDDSPIYKIWQYCRDITNIVFIIYLLVIVYSQITGVGISNYGAKKALPKLIVAAILVNLSYIICQLGIDISNIIGESLRGLFSGVKEATMGSVAMEPVSWIDMFAAISGGLTATVGGILLAVETGTIWMLIPAVLSAVVSIFASVVTMAFRQAMIILLVMISPLAMVSNVFPNTETYFKKWKDALIKMLIFFPAFSLMFGAADLAGWAIITGSGGDTLLVILGVMVQFIPLFFSWKLLKMSGTLPGLVGDKIRAIGAKPIAVNRAWADSHRELTRQKYLASKNAYTPSLKLTQFLSNRRIAREAEIAEHAETVKNRGLAYNANQHYRKDGTISKDGEAAYELQARNLEYQGIITRDKNNFNKGLTDLKDLKGRKSYRDAVQRRRLESLDWKTVDAADNLKYEIARGETIELENARGFHQRTNDAINAHLDQRAIDEGLTGRRLHNIVNDKNIDRYNRILSIMDGDAQNVHFAGADAAYSFGSQSRLVNNKFRSYYDLTPATEDVVHRLQEMTSGNAKQTNDHIEAIVAGMQTLNQRGDTDLIKAALDATLIDQYGNSKIQLGTYASQSLANFLMFDVKGADPLLRRFGKYINLETAHAYNDRSEEDLAKHKRRNNLDITFDEYITGEFYEKDEDGNYIMEDDGVTRKKNRTAKRSAIDLLQGTSFKDMERTAMLNMTQSIRKAYSDENGHIIDQDAFEKKQKEIDKAIFANLIGDSQTFLSGSEQVLAVAQYLTGFRKNKDGNLEEDPMEISDWDKKNLPKDELEELKKRTREFHLNRTKDFLWGHVPNQWSKFKSDIFESVANGLYLQEAKDEYNQKYGENAIEKYISDYKKEYAKTHTQEEVDKLTESDCVKELTIDNSGVMGGKERFRKSVRPQAYDHLIKQNMKGNLGDAKAPIVEYLGLDEAHTINDFYKRQKDKRQGHGDDIILPPDVDDIVDQGGDVESCIAAIERHRDDFIHAGFNKKDYVLQFFDDACRIIVNYLGDDTILSGIGAALPQIPDVVTCCQEIIDALRAADNNS